MDTPGTVLLLLVYHIGTLWWHNRGAGLFRLMDHRYIDEFTVAERYVEDTLEPAERAAFEAHFPRCEECADRVLLAEMFGKPLPWRARFVARFKPWQLVVLFALGALLLLAVPTAYFLWQLWSLSGRR